MKYFCALLSIFCAPLLARAEPVLSQPDETKLLMLDTRVIAHAENARLVLGQPVKEQRNPLMLSDEPWENATNNYYPNVLWDGEQRLWKLWYKDVLADKDVIAQMDGPSTVHEVGWYLLHAHSSDGLVWEKPKVGLHKFAGNMENNIVTRDCPNVGVFKDLHDADASRRFKMVFDVGIGKPRARFSPDGVHWGADQEMLGFSQQQGDTHNNAFFDERSGKYLWFTKLSVGERLVTRLESDDFLHWTGRNVILRSTVEEGRIHQTYAMTVFPYANLYLGYVMMYHAGTNRTVDCELAWSPDALHWQRVQPGAPFLPLGPAGSYDSGCIYAQAGPPVVKDGRLMIYYGGSPTVHLGWKRSGHLCLARLREDGFAAYEPVDASRPATLTTSLLKLADQPLRVIADGEVKVERLPAEHGNTVLRLTISPGAKLYAVQGATLVDTKLPPQNLAPLSRDPVRPEPVVVSFVQDAEGWKGTDRLEHHEEGYITASRARGQVPNAYGTPLAGDWPALLGGESVTISTRVRSGVPGGHVRLELFARDLAQWSYDKLPAFAAGWQEVSATVRYDWSDKDAQEAGWIPAANAFSWRDTIRHAGRLVVMPGTGGEQESFDLDEVRLQPR